MGDAGTCTVLVVEDDVAIRTLLHEFLESEGYRVEAAADGQAAVDILARYQVESGHLCAMLLDMMLPRLDGHGVMRALQAMDSPLPVIALSASREHLAQAMLAGAAVTVAKPFDVEQLLSLVRGYCPRS